MRTTYGFFNLQPKSKTHRTGLTVYTQTIWPILYRCCLFKNTTAHFYRASAHWRAIMIAILSLCLSFWRYAGIVWKRLNHTVANHSSFTSIKHLHEIPTGSPPAGALNAGEVYKFRDFIPINRYFSQTIKYIAIVTREGEWNSYAIYQTVPFSLEGHSHDHEDTKPYY